MMKKTMTKGIILLFLLSSLIPITSCYSSYETNKVYSIHIDENGALSGYVKDVSMNPIDGAKVRVSFHETYEENYTDSSGYYNVTNIPICRCLKNATASKDGYTTEWVLLAIGENTTYDFVLTPLDTIYVDDDNTGGPWDGTQEHPYQHIQDGIDTAMEWDTVFVYGGTYYENVAIDKSIDLIGENRDTTIIDGGGSGDVVYVTADGVNISGFTIQNSGSVYLQDAGIDIRSHFSNFSGNIISNNRYGIYLDGSSNTVTGNIITYNADGILLCGFSNTVLSNIISSNWYGIYLDDSNSNVILKNNFRSNKQHAFFENCTNIWEHNYWNRPRLLPKLIFGAIEIDSKWIPWVNIDWHPAKEPNNIQQSKSLNIAVSKASVYEGETFTVTVTSQGVAVSEAVVGFAEATVLTDLDGKATFTAPDPGVESAVYVITADKESYISAEKSIIVLKLPTLGFIMDDIENTLTVVYVIPSNLSWSDIEVMGDCDTSALDKYVTAGDIITECHGKITIKHIPTDTLLAEFTFSDGWTEFYILNANGTAEDYPRNLSVGEDATVILGLVNHEFRTINYTIDIWLINQTIDDGYTVYHNMWFMDKITVTLSHTDIDIEEVWEPQWEYNYTFNISRRGFFKLAFLLSTTPTGDYIVGEDYEDQAEQIIGDAYRELYLWMEVE